MSGIERDCGDDGVRLSLSATDGAPVQILMRELLRCAITRPAECSLNVQKGKSEQSLNSITDPNVQQGRCHQ